MRVRDPRPLLAVLALGMTLQGCGVRSEPFHLPSPAQQEALARHVRSDPTDVEAAAGLAAALFAQEQHAQAREVLLSSDAVVPGDPTITLMLGLTEHALGRFREARDRYEQYLDQNGGPFAQRVQWRLEAIEPEAVRLDAQALLAGQPSEAPAGMDTMRVVVIPLPVADGSESASALSTGRADLLGRDLALGGFDVVDWRTVDALLEFMAVDPAARFDLSLAERLAGLTGAGRAVTGRIIPSPDGGEMAWEALAITFHPDGRTRIVPAVASAPPERLLGLRKAVTFRIFDGFGVRLRIEDAIAIHRLRTVRPEALAAYGAGLRAQAVTQHQEAMVFFEEAAASDPGFELARESAARGSLLVEASSVPLSFTAERSGQVGERQRAARGIAEWAGSLRRHDFGMLGAGQRSVVAEIMGRDHVGLDLLLELMFEIPPGGGE